MAPHPRERAGALGPVLCGGPLRWRSLPADDRAAKAPSTRPRTAACAGRSCSPSPDGTRSVRRYVSGQTRAEVVRKLDELKREGATGFATGETTGDYLARWVVAVRPRLRAATHREYARHVADYWSSLAKLPLTRLAPAHVEMHDGSPPRSWAVPADRPSRPFDAPRALHDAMRDGLLNRNAAALSRPPRIRAPRDARSVANRGRPARHATAEDRFGPLYAAAVGTGLRLGELLGLEWSDVDLAGRQLTVRRSLSRAYGGGYELAEPKTSRSRRTVMLPALAIDAMRRQKARQAADRLAAGLRLAGPRRTCLHGCRRPAVGALGGVGRFPATAARLGLPVRLHDLRHTAASLMLSAGVPLKVVSEALGHSSIAITADVYAHVTPDLRREAADAMDRALGSGG